MPPQAPTDFTIARIGIDHAFGAIVNKPALRFTFTNNEPNATHLIQSSTNNKAWKDLVEAAGGQASADVHNLALGAKFYFRIRAEFAAQGTFSDWVYLVGNPLITLPKLPTAAVQINAPSGLGVTQNDYRGVRLEWIDNANNESLHILRLSGPGLPAGGLEIGVDHLGAGSYSIPVGFPFSGGNQLGYAKTYTASVKCRGGKQTTAKLTFETDSTEEVSFTTAASHVALVNLPASPEVPRGEAFSFRVLVNNPAELSIVAGAFPDGLALEGDTITGNTIAAEGTYPVSIRADDGATSDTQVLTLRVRTPAFNFTNLPANPVAWNSVPFLFRATTNTPASAMSVQNGVLPAGLAFAGDSISGTPEGVEGSFPITLRAENALTSATSTLSITVRTPAILVLLKPHGTSAAPQPGDAWGEIVAPLGQFFQWDISAQAIGPIAVGTGSDLLLDGAPPWLSINGTSLAGTPDDSTTSDVRVTWSNGMFSGSTTLRIRVPAIQITSAATFSVYEDQAFTFPLASLPAGILLFSDPDEVPRGVGIQSVDANAYVLTGRTSEVGEHTFQIAARLGNVEATQAFTLTVLPIITVSGGDEISGWKGEPILEILTYQGESAVSQWFLVGAPPGVEIAELTCPGPYEGTHQTVAIGGKPEFGGRFDATVIAHVCFNGLPEIHRRPITFLIADELYVPWLHAERLLYDLQFQIRGGLSNRTVRSFYAVPAVAEEKAEVTTKETVPGKEVTTTKTAVTPGRPADIITVKRGDRVTLAVLPRDGRAVLGSADGISDVAIAMRLLESSDAEYLFALPATPVPVDEHEYFGVTLEVTSELLTDLMGDDGILTQPVPVAAELRCKLNGAEISSETFTIQIAEDVHQ